MVVVACHSNGCLELATNFSKWTPHEHPAVCFYICNIRIFCMGKAIIVFAALLLLVISVASQVSFVASVIFKDL